MNNDKCPVCGARRVWIEYDGLEVDGVNVVQKAWCFSCNSRWEENYRFSGINVLSKGKKVPKVEDPFWVIRFRMVTAYDMMTPMMYLPLGETRIQAESAEAAWEKFVTDPSAGPRGSYKRIKIWKV